MLNLNSQLEQCLQRQHIVMSLAEKLSRPWVIRTRPRIDVGFTFRSLCESVGVIEEISLTLRVGDLVKEGSRSEAFYGGQTLQKGSWYFIARQN